MPKTIIINDSIINKGILNEVIEFNQLPKHLRIQILRNKTPLSDNDCFPYENYLEKALASSYDHLSNNDIIKGKNITPNEISKIEKQCQEIEKPVKNNLEELVSKNVCSLFGIPEDKVDFSLTLVDGIDQSKTNVPFGPNEDMPVGLGSIDDINIISKEVTKRRLQNTINAGAADFFTNLILWNTTSNLDEINPELSDLYHRYMLINQFLLFNTEVNITEKDKHETGNVIVTLGNDEVKNQLVAQGVIYPVLLYETIKGFFEVFTAHGIPSNPILSKVIISKCDYYLAEPWYMRLGPSIWGAFYDLLESAGLSKRYKELPWVMMKISQLPAKKYIRLMKEILAGTEKAKRVVKRIFDYATKNVEKQEFDNRMTNNRDNNAFMINDNEII